MKKVLKWLDKHMEESILMVLLAGIVVVMLYQIIRRYIFNSSLSWSEEFCRYSFIWFMFVANSYAIRLGTELRVDAVLNLLPNAAKRVVEFLTMVLCLAVTGYLFYLSFGTVSHVVKTGEVSTGLHLHMKYVYLSMIVGFGMSVIRCVQKIILTVGSWRKEAAK